ncbi:MAG: ribosome maturation protein [Candidatus Woesearchaeota archaeon]|nr:ribosome maturation protein [Candidatus Woesearchaeota archaeon]
MVPFFGEKERAEFNLARVKKNGMNFEVVVIPEKAVALKEKYSQGEAPEESELLDALQSVKVFKDAQKGLLASSEDMKNVFGTDEEEKVALEIIKTGEIQLTSEQRKEIIDRKRNQIIDYIARSAIDPRSKLPHPRVRIEAAMEEAKVRIDEFKPVKEQIPKIIKELNPIIPLSFKTTRARIIVPPVYTGKAYGYLKKFEELKKEDWLDDGSLMVEIELPAAGFPDLVDSLNDLTKGEVEIKRID